MHWWQTLIIAAVPAAVAAASLLLQQQGNNRLERLRMGDRAQDREHQKALADAERQHQRDQATAEWERKKVDDEAARLRADRERWHGERVKAHEALASRLDSFLDRASDLWVRQRFDETTDRPTATEHKVLTDDEEKILLAELRRVETICHLASAQAARKAFATLDEFTFSLYFCDVIDFTRARISKNEDQAISARKAYQLALRVDLGTADSR